MAASCSLILWGCRRVCVGGVGVCAVALACLPRCVDRGRCLIGSPGDVLSDCLVAWIGGFGGRAEGLLVVLVAWIGLVSALGDS